LLTCGTAEIGGYDTLDIHVNRTNPGKCPGKAAWGQILNKLRDAGSACVKVMEK
jgi:hypothetical protein